LGSEVNHAPVSGTKVRKGWSYASTPSYAVMALTGIGLPCH